MAETKKTRKTRQTEETPSDDTLEEFGVKTTSKKRTREASSSEPATKKKKVTAKKTSTQNPRKKVTKSKVTSINENLIQMLNNVTVEANNINFSDLPLVQKPLNNSKKLLYMDNNYVYKGPYSADSEKDIVLLMSVLYRYHVLNMWGDKTLFAHQLIRTTETVDEKLVTKQFYIRMPNYSAPIDISRYEKRMSVMELSTHDKQTVKLFPNFHTGVVSLKQLIGTPLFTDLLSGATESLFYRYLMGIGDSHLSNYIVSTSDQLIQLDIDDVRKSIPTYESFLEVDVNEENEKSELKNLELSLGDLLTTKKSPELDEAWLARSKEEQETFIDMMSQKLNAIAQLDDGQYTDKNKFFLDEFFSKETFVARLKTVEYFLKRWMFVLNDSFDPTPESSSDEHTNVSDVSAEDVDEVMEDSD
jgi:hypothetical protein